MGKKQPYKMSMRTAISNIEIYLLQAKDHMNNPEWYGKPSKKAWERALWAIGQLKMYENYIHYGHYDSVKREEEANRAIEEERGANLTPLKSPKVKPKPRYEWELVYHDDVPGYYTKYVTARCGKCGEWFYGNEKIKPNPHRMEYGAELFTAFVDGDYSQEWVRDVAKLKFINCARDQIKHLPKYCCNCGEEMHNWQRRTHELFCKSERKATSR